MTRVPTRQPRFALAIGMFALKLAAPVAAAQKVTVDDLTTPSAPGFTILDVQPSSIERPQSPRGVALSLLTAMRDGDSLIPKNYALEVAPFWLKSQPKVTFEAYNQAHAGSTMLQTLSLSFATTTTAGKDGAPAKIGIGLGARTLVAKGRASSKVAEEVKSLLVIQDQILDAKTEKEEDALAAQAKEHALAIQKENRNRIGFQLQLAGAVGLALPKDDFHAGKVSKYGFWATPAYRIESPRLSLLGVARYLRDREATSDPDRFDLGGRLEMGWQDLSLSMELVRRLVRESGGENGADSTRVTGEVDYRLGTDMYLTASLGKDRKDPTTGKSGVVSLFGVDFGLSKSPSLPVK